MANWGPTSAWLLVGGCDVTGDIFDMQETSEQVLEECHPLLGGATPNWEVYKPVGVSKLMLECGQGVYDTRTAGMLEAFEGTGQSRQLVGFGFAGSGDPAAHVGAPSVMIDGTYATQFTKKASKGNVTMAQSKHAITGLRYAGSVVAGLVTRNGDNNTRAAYLDLGAPAVAYTGGIFDLHVVGLSLGGGTDVVVKVQDSANHVDWADLATFTAVTAAGTAERKAVVDTIDRYLSVVWTFTGGAAQTVKLLVSAYVYE